jgi:hypothetical protein
MVLVAAHGLQPQVEHDCDFLAGLALGHQTQHLQFARRKRFEDRRQRLRLQIAALDPGLHPVGNFGAQVEPALGHRA